MQLHVPKSRIKKRTNGCPGESHPNAKLTEELVREMRHRFDTDDYDSINKLAKDFHICTPVCRRICLRESWKHVADIPLATTA